MNFTSMKLFFSNPSVEVATGHHDILWQRIPYPVYLNWQWLSKGLGKDFSQVCYLVSSLAETPAPKPGTPCMQNPESVTSIRCPLRGSTQCNILPPPPPPLKLCVLMEQYFYSSSHKTFCLLSARVGEQSISESQGCPPTNTP